MVNVMHIQFDILHHLDSMFYTCVFYHLFHRPYSKINVYTKNINIAENTSNSHSHSLDGVNTCDRKILSNCCTVCTLTYSLKAITGESLTSCHLSWQIGKPHGNTISLLTLANMTNLLFLFQFPQMLKYKIYTFPFLAMI